MLPLLLVLACGAPSPSTRPAPSSVDAAEAPDPVDALVARAVAEEDPGIALELLTDAVARDDDHAGAHYALARLLSQLRNDGGVCRYDAYQDRVLRHLGRAVSLEPALRDRMREEPAFAPLRPAVPYRLIDGGSLDGDEATRALLSGAVFHGLGVGAFGTLTTLTLHPDGRAEVRPTENAAAAVEAGGPVVEGGDGTWSVSDGMLVLDVDGPDRLRVHPSGDLVDDAVHWRAAPAECDA